MLKPNEHTLFEHGTCIFRSEQSVLGRETLPRPRVGSTSTLARRARAGAVRG